MRTQEGTNILTGLVAAASSPTGLQTILQTSTVLLAHTCTHPYSSRHMPIHPEPLEGRGYKANEVTLGG